MRVILYAFFFVPICTAGQNATIESELKNYFDSNSLDPIEGFWMCSYNGETYLKIGIKKSGVGYDEYYVKKYSRLAGKDRTGEIVAHVEETATDGIFYFTHNRRPGRGVLITDGYMEVTFKRGVTVTLIKSYPKSNTSVQRDNTVEWFGNGSGILVSELGYVITNEHVINSAQDIEVEIASSQGTQNFEAEVLEIDEVNDLAIIKLSQFDLFEDEKLPYKVDTTTSDVGTKVYAFGYPHAFVMGKEVKVTDGIISSKSGFRGDTTSYQISAPIQGGNSGGPLFDEFGNLIGVNSSGLSKDIVDNVGYSIKIKHAVNLIERAGLPIELPTSREIATMPLTQQVKEISKCVVLIKVK